MVIFSCNPLLRFYNANNLSYVYMVTSYKDYTMDGILRNTKNKF